MSWTALIALCAISYALKASGPVLAGGRGLRPPVRAALDLVAVPLLAALIVVQTLGDGHRLVLDARAPALGVAASSSGGGRPSWSSSWPRRRRRRSCAHSAERDAAPGGCTITGALGE